jgi:hypothetical protein
MDGTIITQMIPKYQTRNTKNLRHKNLFSSVIKLKEIISYIYIYISLVVTMPLSRLELNQKVQVFCKDLGVAGQQ